MKALTKSTLIAYGTAARSFTADTCTQYGMYRLRVPLRYLEATNATVPAGPGERAHPRAAGGAHRGVR